MIQKWIENPKKKEIIKSGITIAVVILIAFFVRFYVVRTIQVKGDSMIPNFNHNDVVVVNEFQYRFSNPKRNDIVICFYENGMKERFLIKRIIGLPGDEIDLQKIADGEALEYAVQINGDTLKEDYIYERMIQKGDISYPFVVPENCYFVMGDNRNVSSDSRSKEIGPIPKKNILGKVIFRLLPLQKPHFID